MNYCMPACHDTTMNRKRNSSHFNGMTLQINSHFRCFFLSLLSSFSSKEKDITFPISPKEKESIQKFILANYHISKNNNIILKQLKNLISNEEDFAPLCQKSWLTSIIIQDFLQAILHDEKDSIKGIEWIA